jgi:hypothetical protein
MAISFLIMGREGEIGGEGGDLADKFEILIHTSTTYN